MKIRLNKFIAESGYCSRREADSLIEHGKVKINGEVAVVGLKIDTDADKVTVRGQEICAKEGYVYYALNKPIGVVSTAYDPQGRKTVIDFVPKESRVYPVGRLDYDSEGLIILTNDGELTQKLTHPSFEHQKTYFVRCKILPGNFKSMQDVHKEIKYRFEEGVVVEGQLMKADNVSDIRSSAYKTGDISFKIVLHTGYNRQIRKMCQKIGLNVVKLVRTKIAKLSIDDLDIGVGKYKIINREDLV